jgi:hypothetical protein
MIVRESIEFKRGLSGREIKNKLFDFRPGQILIMDKGTSFGRLLAFAGYGEEKFDPDDPFRLRCLEIGQISGDPKLAYFHYGFYASFILKKAEQIRIPNEIEAAEISKKMKRPDAKQYIDKAEEKIGVPLFV